MTDNPGVCPALAKGKRVRVRLVNGSVFEGNADGRGAVNWNKAGSKFDIATYEVLD
jgi:hypothetical protein